MAEASVSAAVAKERPPMFVLQVGIGRYVNSKRLPQLSGAVNDVQKMRELLEGDRYHIPVENIVTLTDADGTKQKIFENYRMNLVEKAKEYFTRTHKRDAVAVFQFSGHGSQVPDEPGGDEKDDHKDETLVTYDSQDIQGKNFDITDDEIFTLTGELKQWTDNIVYILDSCHSGSGTRAPAEDVRRLPPRKTRPEVIKGFEPEKQGEEVKSAEGSGMLPPGNDYIVISAAAADQFAGQKYCFEECGQMERPVVYGELTYYLIEELRNARDDTSYREMMDNVVRRVSTDRPTQTPQIEGDKQRFVFAGLGGKEDSFARVTAVGSKKANGIQTVTIKAGGMQGVAVGTVVSFYDKSVARFDGVEVLGSGRVSTTAPSESTVEILKATREITTDDKAILLSPDLGTARVKVNLDADAAKFTPAEAKVISAVRADYTPAKPTIKDRRGVDLVDPKVATLATTRWDVALLKDKLASVASNTKGISAADFRCDNPNVDRYIKGPDGLVTEKTTDDYRDELLAASKKMPANRDVFYLAGKDFVPLYRFCMETTFADAASQVRAAEQIKSALRHLASLKSVNLIVNDRSLLKGKVVARAVRLPEPLKCVDHRVNTDNAEAVRADAKTGMFGFVPDDVFWIEVVNNSPKDLYLVLLDMPSDGSVSLLSPRNIDIEKAGIKVAKSGGRAVLPGDGCVNGADGNIYDADALRVSAPAGIERFKIIATTVQATREDFEFLELPALSTRGSTASLAAADWTTIDIVFDVRDR